MRTVFVTGAARGIGAAIARAFFEAGDTVVLTDREEAVTATRAALDPGGARTLSIVADVDDEAAFTAAFDTAVSRFGGVDVMVNNAARTIQRSVWDIPAAEWDAVMATNLRGTFFGCRIAGAHLRERGTGGRIINLASIAGQRGGAASGAHYAASKAGILVVTKIFAQELAAHRVTVNAIAPAAIDGPLMAGLDAGLKERLRQGIPVGRFGLDREVAAAALYLASDDAGYVTGMTLDVNGGLLMR
jgi:3-oxoacyl-[acyl-carrier protein] reductase